MLHPESPLQQLLQTMPQKGTVTWLGIRPQKYAPLQSLERVFVGEQGLEGDHYGGKTGKRAVTLIQAEHIQAIASILGKKDIAPSLLRRNIVVQGINLLALKSQRFQIGDAILEYTGLCHPCSRMEEALGAGGYNAVRGHGGITAMVNQPGWVTIGSLVTLLN